MRAQTMEGLIGAGTNMNMTKVPMRVYRQAVREGDTAKMERAMGYAEEFSEKSREYQEKTEEGMKKDAQDAREQEKLARENATTKRREERAKRMDDAEPSQEGTAAFLSLSEAGKAMSEENELSLPDNPVKIGFNADQEPVLYTRNGETLSSAQCVSISVSV